MSEKVSYKDVSAAGAAFAGFTKTPSVRFPLENSDPFLMEPRLAK
jgi:hypothetical protein